MSERQGGQSAEKGARGEWHLPGNSTSNNPNALTLHRPGRWCDLTCVPVSVTSVTPPEGTDHE